MLVLFSVACSSVSKNQPIQVVKRFIKAIDSQRFQDAEKLITTGYRPQFDNIKRFSANAYTHGSIDYKFKGIEKNDTIAVIEVIAPPVGNFPTVSIILLT